MTARPFTQAAPTAPIEESPVSTEYEQWQERTVRRPDDVPAYTPLAWQVEKVDTAADRLGNLLLPEDFPHPVERGTAADALTQLALGESIRRTVERYRAGDVHQALTLGATWTQIGAALDVAPNDARELLRAWADGQRRLYESDVAEGRGRPIGLGAEQYAAVQALLALDDDQPATSAA